MKDSDLVRVNIRISREVKDYFEELSKKNGVPQSALMALALDGYMCQRKTQDFMSKIDFDKLRELKIII